MKLEYFILSPLMCIFAKGEEESCLNSCGQDFDSSLPCQCNTACNTHADCCDDFDDACLKNWWSCVGRCNQPYDHRNQCQCNTACNTHADCCDDYDDACLKSLLNELSTTNYITSDTASNTSVNEIITANYISSDTTLINAERIVGIVISITVVILILVVILALVFRRKQTKELFSSGTVGMGDRITNETNNCTAKLEYEQLDIVRRDKSTNAYNELHVTHVLDQNPTNTLHNDFKKR